MRGFTSIVCCCLAFVQSLEMDDQPVREKCVIERLGAEVGAKELFALREIRQVIVW